MTGSLDPRAARRRYVAACVLFWFPIGLAVTPLILLFTQRGLALTTVAGCFVAHSLTAALLELPTGGLSDVLGRRVVLATSGILNLVAFTVLGLGSAPWLLAIGMGLLGTGRALASGPVEAWYVDTVHAGSGSEVGEVGEQRSSESESELRTGLARGGTATAIALAAGTLLGGGLPWLLGLSPGLVSGLGEFTGGRVLPLSVPPLLAAVALSAFVFHVLTALPEPAVRPSATPRAVVAGIPATVAEGLRLGGRDALVRRVLLGAAATGCALAAVELLTPGRASLLTGAPESGAMLFAVLACTGFLCSAAGSHLAPLTARWVGGGERAVLVGLATGATGLLLLGATAAFSGPLATGCAALAYAVVYLGLGAAGPNENALLHGRVSGAGRATALSVQSLALQAAGALTGPAVAALPPGPTPWIASGAVLLAGSLLWLRRPAPTRRPAPAPRDLVAGARSDRGVP
ncbi:MFS transporter [Streptomyces sp. NPDC101733]|uniref:MFS transporter n=1 Tax=unclassified Streptomyces TaxID=2593676 RepID=UPI0037FC9825